MAESYPHNFLLGKERVERGLEQFLALSFFPRTGGGISMTRMISAFKQMNSIFA
jgi:hypothetical protein